MAQQGLRMLSNTELKLILFAIFKIKLEDAVSQEYTFELADFCKLCDVSEGDIEGLKNFISSLADKSWLVEISPNITTVVRWFKKVWIDEKSGTVTVRFDDDIMPYLLKLKE